MKEESPNKDVKSLFAEGNEHEFEIEGFQFRIKKLDWGDKEDIRETSMRKKAGGHFEINIKEMNLNAILKSLVGAPFKINRENICKLDSRIGDELLFEVNRFTGLGGGTAKNSKDLLKEKESSE